MADRLDGSLADAALAGELHVGVPHQAGVELARGGDDCGFALAGGEVGLPADVAADLRRPQGQFRRVEQDAEGAGDLAAAKLRDLVVGLRQLGGHVIARGQVR